MGEKTEKNEIHSFLEVTETIGFFPIQILMLVDAHISSLDYL